MLSMIQLPSLAFADTNVLQNQAVNGGTINQNIVFIDLKQDHWASEAIQDMARKGILSGYEDSSFQPDKSITREEFAKLIALTFSLSLQSPADPTYSDVDKSSWSYSYIESTKEFLTGYYPPRGRAFFSPETKATREDVAVALVKVMGLGSNDLVNPNILSYTFRDVSDISIGLRDYVAIATEKKLIDGYSDRTFRPNKEITRAEVATLLYKVIKSSAHDQMDGPALEVTVPDTTSDGTVYVSGKTSRDAKVTINGKPAALTDGSFKEGVLFEQEGEHTVTVAAKLPSGKTNSVEKKVTFKVGAPSLTINDVPATVSAAELKLSGSVKDASDSKPVVYLNDEVLYVSWDGTFSKTVTLEEGENTLTFKAKNDKNKESLVTKKVSFTANGPALVVNSIPESTQLNTVTVSGKVTDKNDPNPVVYINDQAVYMSYDNSFSKELTLDEGNNTITFKAQNKNGKITTVTKSITFNNNGPALVVNSVPESTQLNTVTVSGKVTDKNDPNPAVYINDQAVYLSYDKSFSKEITLTEGENTIIFKAQNKDGKITTVTRSITFTAGGPTLVINYVPESTQLNRVTVSGKVTDKNDPNPAVYINDQAVYAPYNSTFSKEITLTEGDNIITFRAENKNGKMTTVTRSIRYEVSAPVITLGYLPETTSLASITVTGTVTDKNDPNPFVYLNDRLLYANYGGTFSSSVSLQKGANPIKIVVTNKSGLTSTVTRTVYRND
ncbi:S-layer homology domain-containing protein [Paenibacillus ginsengarvi]|uniref:S-layer homology domain-containing protein n=2 Tax=Paenibacillus ginsengarvi TaxID=400777 RepID=A0A3B0AYW9_9BACL|nr:S-layer homology domain-containing protein [Paenibacillus ginsengarvi]